MCYLARNLDKGQLVIMRCDKVVITVFTPTFNRCNELIRLYKSLYNQTKMNFEWIVVDDGSSDNTREYVQAFQQNSPFTIRYIHQVNSGKHVAHNLAANISEGRYFICVDSDDWLEPNAIETVLEDLDSLGSEEGLIYPRLFTNQIGLNKWFQDEVAKVELADIRMKFGLVIETAIVFNTSVLRRHPFPAIVGEHYMPEESSYYDFKSPEVFLVRNETFYRCEYLDEGLTKNIWHNWIANPIGTQIALEKRYETAKCYSGVYAIKNRIGAIIGLESLHMACVKHAPYPDSMKSLLALAVLPFAMMLCWKRFGAIKL